MSAKEKIENIEVNPSPNVCCHLCGGDINGLNDLFRGSVVEGEFKAFRNKGPKARQWQLLAPFKGQNLSDKRSLDIGCGIGGLSWQLASQGAKAMLVDVSKSYLEKAQQLFHQHQLKGEFILGDFVTLEQGENLKADIVLLDRVVCCYPEGPKLLEKAALASQDWLIFSYPSRRGFIATLLNAGRFCLNGAMKLFAKEYRFFLHPAEALYRAAGAHQHQLIQEKPLGIWTVAFFRLAHD
ncbi:MAG: methyltransferase domain-containing protein [Deinococcales bacterium]